MHRKPLDGWTRASHSSRCPVLLLSAKIRCCHLRNNTLSMWYEVFFDSVGALCTDCVKLAFLFLESWGLLTVCFFFCVCVFFCVTFHCHSLADDWRGACQSIFSLPFQLEGRLLMEASTESPPRQTPRWGSFGDGPLCQSPSIVL